MATEELNSKFEHATSKLLSQKVRVLSISKAVWTYVVKRLSFSPNNIIENGGVGLGGCAVGGAGVWNGT